ncbi:class 1b ribonucleoside-diphosphate reductase subunit beta [Staphylococcus pseudintermedius]|nr:class 1b ribonucleoside-diphosphate reductase subunit beta [Staphylococcus pseudintermedius]
MTTIQAKATNWDKEHIALTFWKQNVAQMWTEDEFKPSKDITSWKSLSKDEQEVYIKVLSGLAGLDTTQAAEGMPLIQFHYPHPLWSSVFSFMGMMENIHHKSYTHIFTTLIDRKETEYYLEEWVPANKYLNKKTTLIAKYYRALLKEEVSDEELYMAMVASVFLESFLFYSGFYYPLLLSGQGKMIASGEIIRKIILDENIHGVGVGIAAQDIYNTFDEETKKRLKKEMMELFDALYFNECEYTASLYDSIGLTEDVIRYIQYNGNKALMNLGHDVVFNPDPFNPIVENGLNTETKNHDFFSTKGDGYVLSLNNKDLRDKDFDFNNVESYEISKKFLNH